MYDALWHNALKYGGKKALDLLIITKFVQKFVNPDAVDDETFLNMVARATHYLQRLEEIAMTKEPFLPINYGHIQQLDEDLYRQLACYPAQGPHRALFF